MKKHTLAIVMAATLGALSGCNNDAQTNNIEKADNSSLASDEVITTSSNEISFEKFELENGLDVIFHIDRSDPVVSVALTSHVGSARELPGRTGFAHLFEHLLFLESENLGKGGLDKMSARIGGSGANGSTSRDRTNYFQTVPNDALEKMIWAEADKLGYFINTVSEPVLAKEKQVVKNEKRQGVDNRPYGHTQYVIDKNLYPEGHPYSWQVIGSLEDLQSATLDDVKQFFKRWYVPNNVTLVVAGDFDVAQAKQWVKKYFDEIPRGQDIQPNPKMPVVLEKNKNLYFEDNFARLPELTITWPTVELYHQDSYALSMLVNLLSQGKKAPLNKVLIDDKALTSRVVMYGYESELAGQLMLRVRAFDGVDLDTAYDAIQHAFSLFEQDKFTDKDLARIKAGIETDYYQGLSSVLGKGFNLAQYNIFKGDPGFINEEIKIIQNITADDIWRVYNKYVKNKPAVITSFVPKGKVDLALENSEAANVVEEKIVQGAEQSFDASKQVEYTRTPSSFDRSVEPPYGKAPVITPPSYWKVDNKNGLKVYGIDNQEVPLVRVTLDIDGGMLFDNKDKLGTANIVAQLMNRGTKTKTPAQLEEAIQQLGASIDIEASREGVHIDVSTLAKNFEQTMAIVAEMLLSPRWDEAEFALVKKQVLSQIQQSGANPNAIAANEFNQLLYGKDHVLSRRLIGDKTSVDSILIDDVKAFYQAYIVPNLSRLYVVGAATESEVKKAIAPLVSDWKPNGSALPVITEAKLPEKSAVYFYDVPGAKQSVINLGYPAMKSTEASHYGANVMNYIFGGGGFASKLTQELREAKGYTYGVRSRFYGSRFAGNFAISSGVRTNVTLEAIEAINAIMNGYAKEFSKADLDTTQSYYIKSNARRFETLDAKINILQTIAEQSLPDDYIQRRASFVESLTIDDVKSIAKKELKTNNMIYLVVGDAKSQLGRLESLGLGKPVLLNP